MALTSIKQELEQAADTKRAENNKWFFKTGPGEYGEGDEFIGLTVPATRSVAKKYALLPFGDIEELLQSRVHEFRLCGLLILVNRFEKFPDERQKIYEFYLNHTSRINNWDLVDLSSHAIVGEYLQDKQRKKLYELARSRNLWERRIAVVSTAAFINRHQFADTLAITEILLGDEHDLMHKACGWMLREVGKRNKTVLETFLKKHAAVMPRTMLRYAIERFRKPERKHWMDVKKGRETIKAPEAFSRKSALFERVRKR